MRLLVSGCTRTVAELAQVIPERLGILLTPKNRTSMQAVLARGLPWAIDNGAFNAFDEKGFLKLLERARGLPRCLFVAAPDVVGKAAKTLAQWPWWSALIRSRGLPVAFVGQDGQENLPVPWGTMHAYFVGGSTKWKLSQASADLCQEARRQGLYIHIGRVNSMRRLRTAYSFGADSVDGSSMSMFGDAHILKFARCIECIMAREQREPDLFQ